MLRYHHLLERKLDQRMSRSARIHLLFGNHAILKYFLNHEDKRFCYARSGTKHAIMKDQQSLNKQYIGNILSYLTRPCDIITVRILCTFYDGSFKHIHFKLCVVFLTISKLFYHL